MNAPNDGKGRSVAGPLLFVIVAILAALVLLALFGFSPFGLL